MQSHHVQGRKKIRVALMSATHGVRVLAMQDACILLLSSYNFDSSGILTLESDTGKFLAGVNDHKHVNAEFV